MNGMRRASVGEVCFLARLQPIKKASFCRHFSIILKKRPPINESQAANRIGISDRQLRETARSRRHGHELV
jgi:hypothetical protein